MTPDVIVCWPRNCDYPLWRAFIARERHRFAKVIVVFTEHDGHDYRDFVRRVLGATVTCLDSDRGDHDWRDVAVNAALAVSDAEYVWFTEQDFLIIDAETFWSAASRVRRALGFRDENRWHPASLFVQRRLIEQTDRYFGPDPTDHFTAFGRQLDDLTVVDPLPYGSFEHLQGVSQNHYLIDTDSDAGVFHRERFREYLRASLAAPVELHPWWSAIAHRELEGSAPL